MKAITSMFWHSEAERLHVIIELINYPFDTHDDPLDGLEVHGTKLLRDIRIISLYQLLDEFLHSGVLVLPWVSEDILKNEALDVS